MSPWKLRDRSKLLSKRCLPEKSKLNTNEREGVGAMGYTCTPEVCWSFPKVTLKSFLLRLESPGSR